MTEGNKLLSQSVLRRLQGLYQSNSEEMRYRTEQHVPHGSPQLCYNHLPVERRTYRDALEDVGIPEHSHNADLRKSYGGKNELQHGETLAAYRTTGELRLSGYIIQSSKTNPR